MASHNEQRIAEEIMKTVRRLQLPLKLDEITEGKGNCFPLSILAQGRRVEIYNALNERTQTIIDQNNPTLLRKEIVNFMIQSRHSKIKIYKEKYEDVIAKIDNRSWQEYWELMSRNYEWVDYIFIQATAWYLNHDILIVTTGSTDEHPYITISGNIMDENMPCPGVPFTIGSKLNVHYQSLLPLEVKVTRSQTKTTLHEEKSHLPDDTIELILLDITNSDQTVEAQPRFNSTVKSPYPTPPQHKQDIRKRKVTKETATSIKNNAKSSEVMSNISNFKNAKLSALNIPRYPELDSMEEFPALKPSKKNIQIHPGSISSEKLPIPKMKKK